MTQLISNVIPPPDPDKPGSEIVKYPRGAGGRRATPPPARVLNANREGRKSGFIIRIKASEGYGFVRPDDGPPEYYVHVSAMSDRSKWLEGQRVTFFPGPVRVGGARAPLAHNVQPEILSEEAEQ